ncbi:MAG: flagellar basal-body rod modification protein FlgD [Alphaproteobacteria bacterium]|nr:flagellar basal-body rod modification protein FlgD [Alphaproteobacteria bacterium]
MAAATSLLPAITNSVAATTKSGATGASPASAGADTKTIAGNFNTFLTLLTTQLKNQNPLDPLDTNQFTQQLVQFAQVEQQIKQNDQLATMISIERAAQATTALAFVGATVAVDGQTAALTDSRATWSLQVPKPVSATVTIKTSTGQTAYSGSFSMSTGTQNFTWDGRGNNGTQWPAGNYTISITGTDASGQTVAIATEIHGVVDSVDLTKTPPLMAIGGQNFTLDKIKRVVRPGT